MIDPHETTAEEQLQTLNETFGLPGALAFELHPGTGMIRAQITLASAAATVYLHGGHITHWQPAGQQPVLFLSEQSAFVPGKAIRGGIPICFPWFGPRSGDIGFGQHSGDIKPGPGTTGQPGPSHGFARISDWQVTFAALVPGGGDPKDDVLHLTLTLEPNDLSRSLGFDHFRAACEFRIGRTLELRLSCVNLGAEAMRIEEALHTYFRVSDVRHVALTGLESAEYLDKTDGGRQKQAVDGPLRLTATTDRVFPGNRATLTIVDRSIERSIVVAKANSATTVVWNPWAELARTLTDLGDDAWPHFLCVEAANTATDAVTLRPSEAHTLELVLSCEPHAL